MAKRRKKKGSSHCPPPPPSLPCTVVQDIHPDRESQDTKVDHGLRWAQTPAPPAHHPFPTCYAGRTMPSIICNGRGGKGEGATRLSWAVEAEEGRKRLSITCSSFFLRSPPFPPPPPLFLPSPPSCMLQKSWGRMEKPTPMGRKGGGRRGRKRLSFSDGRKNE